jgi:hypothetical protein
MVTSTPYAKVSRSRAGPRPPPASLLHPTLLSPLLPPLIPASPTLLTPPSKASPSLPTGASDWSSADLTGRFPVKSVNSYEYYSSPFTTVTSASPRLKTAHPPSMSLPFLPSSLSSYLYLTLSLTSKSTTNPLPISMPFFALSPSLSDTPPSKSPLPSGRAGHPHCQKPPDRYFLVLPHHFPSQSLARLAPSV